MKTHWFDLLFLEPPTEKLPGIVAHVAIKNSYRPNLTLPEGEEAPLCIGHQALGARELEGYVAALKAELDEIVKEAKRRGNAYHQKLRGA